MRLLCLLAYCSLGLAYLKEVPPEFQTAASSWAWISYEEPSARVIDGLFNRSVFSSQTNSESTSQDLNAANQILNETDFWTYDARFFDLIGPRATITKIQNLTYQVHEASCYNPDKEQLLFVEWGPPGGIGGLHTWQYLLDVRTNELTNVTIEPPIPNVHGCVFYDNHYYLVNDGSVTETAALHRVDPNTLTSTKLVNNYYQQPFGSFNDLDVDPNGNFWLTDWATPFIPTINPYSAPTRPTLYFINGTDMRPQPVHITSGYLNGVSVSRTASGFTVYAVTSGDFTDTAPTFDPYFRRDLNAFDVTTSSAVLQNHRLLNNPIEYFYDGIRASRNGYIFAGAGGGVDVIDPASGLTLGSIRVGAGENIAVNVAFGEHEMWIVGYGGVWHVQNINEELARAW